MKSEKIPQLQIKDWSPDDRPREKLQIKGATALSDAELIAILLGSGTTKFSAVELAKKVMQLANNDLNELGRLSLKDLMQVSGIGEAKAVMLLASMEFGRRRRQSGILERPQITTSRDAFDLLCGELMDLPHEEFWVLLLNRANRVIKKKKVSEGGVSGTVADPRIIFKLALEELASGVVVAHNHPSGNLSASHGDRELTRKLKESGQIIEIPLLDHIIIAGNKYFSFADEGIL